MSFLATTFTSVNDRNQLSGRIWRIKEDFSNWKRIYLPPSSAVVFRKPSGFSYGNRHYLVGGHTANILVDEEFRGLRQGIQAPATKPVVTTGGGTTPQIAYFRFFDEITGERGPLSEGFEFTGDLSRSWSSIPTEVPNEQLILEGLATIAGGTVTGVGVPTKTNFSVLRPGDRIANAAALTRWAQVRLVGTDSSMTIDDSTMAGVGVSLVCKPVSRVSHVELWLAVSGALPRFVMRVRIGTTSVSESTATLALGEAESVSFTSMPFGELNLFYNDRQLIAGVEGSRDTVYLSAIGFPERYEGFKFVTAYNEPIVGMFRYRDYVVLLCPDSSYRLQGYTLDDYVRTVLEPKVGGLGHHGNQVTETYALVPGRKGVQIFNGGFRPGISARISEWSADYISNRLAWELGFSAVNPNDQTYQFYPRFDQLTVSGLKPYVYVAQYDSMGPVAGGGTIEPEWLSDTHVVAPAVRVTAAAYLVPSGTRIGKMYRGTDNGKIYEEDETGAIVFTGTSVIVPGHFLGQPMDPGGGEGEGEGKKLTQFWSYVVTEFTNALLRIWPGDEYAYPPDILPDGTENAVDPSFQRVILASQAGFSNGLLAPKVVHEDLPLKSGRGWTFEWRWTNPRGGIFIGCGGKYVEGRPARNPWSDVSAE